MEEYSEGFIENGYDDLETVKLIEREDLIAIGVNRSDHQVAVMRKYKVVFYLKHFKRQLHQDCEKLCGFLCKISV